MVELFKDNIDWRSIAREGATPRTQKILSEVQEVLSVAGRQGYSRDDGILEQPMSYVEMQLAREQAIREFAHKLATESGGGMITPDMYPNFFDTKTVDRGTPEKVADTSYLDWMVQSKMTDTVEERDEWNAHIQFVLMKDANQVRYGTFADRTAIVRNYEWGGGFKIFRTWFETNKFGVKMSRLLPKVRYRYFNNIATQIYAQLEAGITTGITGATNTLVTDLNIAWYELMRYEDDFDDTPYEDAQIRIIAAPEWEKYLNAAMAVSFNLGYTETLSRRMSVTYTPKLSFTPGAAKLYVMVDKWEQNEYNVRVPFTVFGQTTDVDTFADKQTYRGAWGSNIDATSGRVLTFDTTSGFEIAPPIPTRTVT